MLYKHPIIDDFPVRVKILENAVKLIESKGLSIDMINPSQDEGIMIEFRSKNNEYCMVEIFNDGNIVFLTRTEVRSAWNLTYDNYYEFIDQWIK